ncbi:MAG TPA: hypothetical protein VGO71_05045 [Baekduia sp.]|nr:hypothetical protein [Baekduia sp.]
MPSHIPHRVHARRLLPALLAGLAISFAFIAFFTSALRDPQPNGVAVAVVGPPSSARALQRGLDQALPGGFGLRRYAGEADARRALTEQDVDGVYVVGARPRLLVASGAGASTTNALRTAFGAAAGAQSRSLAVADAAPLPQHDSRGLSAFFLVAGISIGSLVFAAGLFFLGGHAHPVPLRLKLALIGAFATAAGLVVAIDTDFVAGGLVGAFWGVAGIAALLAAAVALITTAVVRWFGLPGIGLCVLTLMIFSLPASGGAVGPEFVPDFYRDIAPILPSHAALLALRGTVYFHGGGTTAPILVLLAWAAGAVTAIIAAHALRREPPRLPVLGVISGPDLPS